MPLFFLFACAGAGDSAKVDDTSLDTADTSGGSDTNDTEVTDPGPPCSSWLGFEEGRVWTHMLRDAGNDTVATITASLEDPDLEAGTVGWNWSQDVDYGAYREVQQIHYDMVCSHEEGAVRTGGTIRYEYIDSETDFVTETIFTYTPGYVILPPDFGPGARWEVEVEVNQEIDGVPSSGVNYYRLEADGEAEIETFAGTYSAVQVHTTDVNANVSIDAEWYADTWGLVATEFTTVSEIVTF